MIYDPWQIPDNPFDYHRLIDQPQGIGVIPLEKVGTRIAIIGAGCAGLCAAWELAKIGLHPVVYESDHGSDGYPRIGGRAYTWRFPGDPKAFAELGAMRIPPVHRTLTYYMDLFDIDYSRPFPDPLLVPTSLYFRGVKNHIPVGGALPASINRADAAWKKFISPLVQKMAAVWHDPIRRQEQWAAYEERFEHKSFYQVLNEHGMSDEEISLFGSLGLGTGGFDSLFPICFLEQLRLAVCKWDVDQRIVKGGVVQIPLGFWETVKDCRHWGKTSVKALNSGTPLGRVTRIELPRSHGDRIKVVDAEGNAFSYEAAIITCSHRALETGIKIDKAAFSESIWSALQNLHMTRSGKIFIRTREAFWKKHPPEKTLNCTITDEAVRGTYLFDFDDTPSGVICLSYTWEDAATKLHALSEEDRVAFSLEILKTIYDRDLISDQVAESKTWFWEHEKGYNGAFKLLYPGQQDQQSALFNQTRPASMRGHHGIFLSGESTSWAGGWIEGALQSGLDAAMAVVRKIRGQLNE